MHLDVAARRLQHSRQDLQQGALSGAIRPDNAKTLAALYVAGYVAQSVELAKTPRGRHVRQVEQPISRRAVDLEALAHRLQADNALCQAHMTSRTSARSRPTIRSPRHAAATGQATMPAHTHGSGSWPSSRSSRSAFTKG